MNIGIFFSGTGKIAQPLLCMVNKKHRQNEYNGPENREKLGGYVKWTDYTEYYLLV